MDRTVDIVIALVGLIGILAALGAHHYGAAATLAGIYLIVGVAGSLRDE
jgi:hypothetical protein